MDFIFGKMDFVGLLTVALGDRKIYHFYAHADAEEICHCMAQRRCASRESNLLLLDLVYLKKCNKWVALFCVL